MAIESMQMLGRVRLLATYIVIDMQSCLQSPYSLSTDRSFPAFPPSISMLSSGLALRRGRRYNAWCLSSLFGWLIHQSVCSSYSSDYVLERDDPVVHRSAQADVGSYNERRITCAQ